MAPTRDPLPIDEVLPAALAALASARCLVVEAPPGAGKTTRVPLAIHEAGLAGGREVVVLQPRRLAARLTAARVAETLGEPLGATVGYQVRFESATSPATRIRFITEGLLPRKLHADPELRGVGAVVLDEFHERHLDGDLGLALLRRLQLGPRPDLKLIVMSATLDGERVAAYLSRGDEVCARVSSQGRAFPVATEHLGASSEAELPSAVLRALAKLLDEGLDGDVLVFLPGAREIQRAAEACAGLAAHAGLRIVPLHGELPPDQQDLAVRPCPQRKLILSTNVAETSVTIDGVAAVIDGGLARVAAHDPWTGIPTLQLSKISRASAAQRAGRAGRTRPGRCLRLYSQHDHDRRLEFTPPEVQRVDLSGALLDLHALGIQDPVAFPWFEAPPTASLQAGEALLRRLSLIDRRGEVSAAGRRALAFPLHPRLGRLLVEGIAREVPRLACGAAALLSERPIRAPGSLASCDADADVLVDLADLERLRRRDEAPRGVLPGPARRVLQVRDQLLRALDGGEKDRSQESRLHEQEREDRLRIALLTAFPDRVAQAREDAGGTRALALAGGGAAKLGPGSVVRTAPWLLALEVEQRREGERGAQVLVRGACAIEPDWLIDLFAEEIEERDELTWDAERERVVGGSELRYMGLLIERTPRRTLPAEASALLREAALAAGPERLVSDPEALQGLVARTAFAAGHAPELTALDEATVRTVLAELCEGRTSFAELRSADLLGHLLARCGGGALDRLAPTHVTLPGGRRAQVHYEPGKPPWLASRLQDFFGMSRGPALAGGKVPVVLHLLAPNGRAEQITTDLAGFWERHYPEVRKALMRRYPRHAWPEDPRTAAPPTPRR